MNGREKTVLKLVLAEELYLQWWQASRPWLDADLSPETYRQREEVREVLRTGYVPIRACWLSGDGGPMARMRAIRSLLEQSFVETLEDSQGSLSHVRLTGSGRRHAERICQLERPPADSEQGGGEPIAASPDEELTQ